MEFLLDFTYHLLCNLLPIRGNIFILEGGEVALLDCGQVKQLTTAQRMRLAALVLLVHRWETLNRQLLKIRSRTLTLRAEEAQENLKEMLDIGTELDQTVTDLAASVKSFGELALVTLQLVA